jgi:hypothetical protein
MSASKVCPTVSVNPADGTDAGARPVVRSRRAITAADCPRVTFAAGVNVVGEVPWNNPHHAEQSIAARCVLVGSGAQRARSSSAAVGVQRGSARNHERCRLA